MGENKDYLIVKIQKDIVDKTSLVKQGAVSLAPPVGIGIYKKCWGIEKELLTLHESTEEEIGCWYKEALSAIYDLRIKTVQQRK